MFLEQSKKPLAFSAMEERVREGIKVRREIKIRVY